MKFKVVFADWKSRVGRSDEWRDQRRANFPSEDMWRREYPETIEDVLLAAEEGPFPAWTIRQCTENYEFPVPPVSGHRYLKMWDQGRTHDAFVGVVLDITKAPYRLVEYKRYLNKPYPVTQGAVTEVHNLYPGLTYVGDDNAAKAIVENLKIPATHFLVGSLKSRCIMALKVALEQAYIRLPGIMLDTGQFDGPTRQLHFELVSYLWDDKGLIQDSVMALANCMYIAGPPINIYDRPLVSQTEGRASKLNSAPQRAAVRAPFSTVGRQSRRFMHRMASDSAQSKDVEYIR